MALRYFTVLNIFLLFTCPIIDAQYEDVINEVFNQKSRTVFSTEVFENIVSSNTSCGLGKVCVQENLCSSGNRTAFDLRLSEDKNREECPAPHICCSIKDIVTNSSFVPSTEIIPKCGYRNVDGVGFRIEGNLHNQSQFGEFPWMVAILKSNADPDQNRNIYVCGGSLIHPQVALTAAHCVNENSPKVIAAGKWESNTENEIFPSQVRNISEIIIHPNFNNRSNINDIALVFLNSPFYPAPHINTVCLPPENTSFDYDKCIATGWGKDRFINGNHQNILKKIEVPVVPNAMCQNNLRKTRLGNYFQLHESFLCAGGELGKDTCLGDGGSPLVCPIENEANRYYVAGLVSWGIECGKQDVPGVYVNVSKLSKWIDGEINKKLTDTLA